MISLPFIRHAESKPTARRLAMVAVVRNEFDVIDTWIRYHAAYGVDCFIVLDNGSTDGTREHLEHLRQQFDITIFEDHSECFYQNRWMTRLCRYARKIAGAEWAIASDADEFWIPDTGVDLKSIVTGGAAVKRFARFNMVVNEQLEFYRAFYCARGEVAYPRLTELKREHMSVILKRPGPKVALRLKGLLRISGGNHGAWHLAATPKPVTTTGLTIYHYPIRGLERFVQSLNRYRTILARNPQAPVGAHWKRWSSLRTDAQIQAEYRRLVFTPRHCEALYEIGLLRRCTRPAAVISAVVGARSPCVPYSEVRQPPLLIAL